ncbi:MAG: EAL domain-containing protein [Spirochaetales bacterium]|nr:EAL domain-containing protein [Spirochaetales bacterium]
MLVMDYDVVAVLINTMTLSLFYAKKRVSYQHNFLFVTILWLLLSGSLINIPSVYGLNNTQQVPLILTRTFLHIAFIIFHTLPFLTALYISSRTRLTLQNSSTVRLTALPWVSAMLLIASNPFTGWIFTLTERQGYLRGPLYPALYLPILFYVALIARAIMRPTRKVKKRDGKAFMIALLLPVIAIILKPFFPHVLLESFATSLVGLFILLTIQNSADLIDGTTGLFSKSAFTRLLQERIDEKSRFTLLAIHLSDVRAYQNIYGVRVFTSILKAFTAYLLRLGGKNAVVFTLGEGLFAIIPARTTQDALIDELALTVVKRSEQTWTAGPVRIRLPLHVGILRCEGEAGDVQEILDRIQQVADIPESMGNRHIFFDSDLRMNKLARETSIIATLTHTWERKQPKLRFQPIMSDGRPIAVEVLLGCTTAAGEWILQSEAIRTGEKAGLGKQLGELIMESSFRWYTDNNIYTHGIEHIQIRILRTHCVDRDLCQTVLSLAKKNGMDLHRVCFQITEDSVANATEHFLTTIRELLTHGCTFALDDYGSGYTDMHRIFEIPFSMVKFDKRVIKKGLASAHTRKLITGSVALFTRQGYQLVAEGVESETEHQALKAIGFDYFQGYHFARPLNEVDFQAFLR